MSRDITDFSARLQDLLDETEASYIELLGTLELVKQRLLMEAIEEEDSDYEEEDDAYDDD
ncbi:MAG: hypothetical protein AAGG11_05340 [Pseudomonadota bacterium]